MNDTRLFSDWLPESYDPCGSRHGGAECSAEAHAKIVSCKKGLQSSILELARARGGAGLTVKDVARHFGTGTANVSGRLTELKLLGLLVRARDAAGHSVKRDGAAVLVVAKEAAP